MKKTNCSVPPTRQAQREAFGYLSFNVSLINLDIIGVKLRESGEVVVLMYRGAHKVGYVYEGEKLTPKQAFITFDDAPDNYNEFDKYIEFYQDRLEVLAPIPDNYVFINDQEIVQTKHNDL